MKAYLISLALGLLVGVIYALFQVRSPAPPVVALIGLLGILLGEQLPPLIKQVWAKEQLQTSWVQRHVMPHVFGDLPCANPPALAVLADGRTSHDNDQDRAPK
jgi:XapX domain-containing protein